ncbi:PilZ domain-containing protein [Clostridium weizhouense]|uniref:PilZ domain-containing protein n=1 Tax=Clostridium weizhouense TaxID=2859781 RepID=A0ABS7ARH4_9CLOT|nr:PilZ domain-containing protein [Clostridium weizhouense]MBW6411275.1 PilZ domain-containing protein [Clostridium weizhouense]
MLKYSLVKITSIDDKTSTNGIVDKFRNNTLTMFADEKTELKFNEEIFINIFDKDDGISIYSGVICNIFENTITINNVKYLFSNNRRDSNRIIVNIPLQINKIRKKSKEAITLSKPILMTSKNLSINGILLESPLNIPKNINFFIELPIDNNFISIETFTKRKYEKNNLYYYGCEFNIHNDSNNSYLENFILKNYNSKFFKYYPK